MNEEILKTIREKGILLEKEIFDLVTNLNDSATARVLLENLEKASGQKIITKSVLTKNMEYAQKIVGNLMGEQKQSVENVFIKLGISLEIRKESEIVDSKPKIIGKEHSYQIFYADTKADKKLEVSDFTNNFRARYQQIQRMLMGRPEIAAKLTSINKISNDRQQISIIGMVKDKRLTKNKNLIVTFEDLTGEIGGVIKLDREEIFRKANELVLDDIVGVRASGSREMLFVQDIVFPEAMLSEKTKFEDDVSIAFISDMHCGSGKHLEKSVENFIDWLNSGDELAGKIKYMFIVGDNVDGVGIFPGQDKLLKLKSMGEQYKQLTGYLKRVPKHITMFMCPGQHDAVRVAEPQPIIGKKYAPGLYDIENLVLVTNPTLVKLLEGKREFRVLMYHGASIHGFINAIPELRENKAHKSPAKAVKHMLKRRHLAPMHQEFVYIPNADKDPLVISEVPDVLCTGEVHRVDVENYNNILILTGSCWQGQTDFEEKVGNIPDPCKVPILNLKTRELKILDFGDEEELKEIGGMIAK